MKSPSEIRSSLAQFTGSDSFTKWSILYPRHVLTDGARFVAEECGAYWLADLIASHQTNAKVRAEEFQVWKLAKYGKGWKASAEDGNGNVIAVQLIGYSDFPLEEGITLWANRNELNGITILLPSEY
jgi:hypothetical protein